MKRTNLGAALRADVISAKYAAVSKPLITHGSGRHKEQQHTLQRYGYCVIDQPMKWADQSTPALLQMLGDAIEGTRIAIRSRRFKKHNNPSFHQQKKLMLYTAKISGNVYAVIEKPLRAK